MKEDHDKPLEALGNEVLEARVVAWVLGEASPFEAAELEERCAREPELALFARRMREVHGLIGESGAAAGLEWRLSEERRRKVTDLLGVDAPSVGKVRRFPVRWLGMAAAACLLGLLILGAMVTLTGSVGEGAKMLAAGERRVAPASPVFFASDGLERESRSKGEVTREFHYLTESEAPARPASGPPTQPALSRDSKMYRGSPFSPDSESPAEEAVAANGALPVEPAQDLFGTITGGLRSGDGAITRDSIDAVLNRPGRVSGEVAGSSLGFDMEVNGTVTRINGKPVGEVNLTELAELDLKDSDWDGRSVNEGQSLGISMQNRGLADRFGLAKVAQGADGERFAWGIQDEGRKAGGTYALDSLVSGEAPIDSSPQRSAGAHRGSSGPSAGRAWFGTLGADSDDSVADAGASEAEVFYNFEGFSNDKNDRPVLSAGGAVLGRSFQGGLTKDLSGLVDRAGGAAGSGERWDVADLPQAQPALAADEVMARNNVDFIPQSAWPSAAETAGKESNLAGREMLRPQSAVVESDRVRDEAREAYAKGDFGRARGRYEESLQLLPDAALPGDRREFLEKSLADAEVAQAEQFRRVGKYEEARQLLDQAESRNPGRADVSKQREWLEDPVHTEPALTETPAADADAVRRGLYLGESHFNLGNFDKARGEYEDVLRKDPYNKAARRGLEKVSAAKSDYYRAAYDHTRAELLAQVDRAWESGVPPEADSPEVAALKAEVLKQQDLVVDKRKALTRIHRQDKLYHAQPESERKKAQVDDEESKAVVSSIARRGYEDVRSEYESSQRILEALETKLATLTGQPIATSKLPEVDPQVAWRALDSMAEVSADAEPFSTFSLHVSDASFKLASAAIERGEVPAAESIRPEEFYNAFDYGDPAPSAGEPVACVVEQCAHPAFPQRNLLRIAVRTGAEGRAASVPLNLTVLVDNSGSMEREDRADGVRNAVAAMASLLKPGDTVTMAGFARSPRLLADRVDGSQAERLNGVVMETPSEGGTNLEEGLKLADELARRQFNAAAQNRVVLFTDGAANLGDANPESLNRKVEEMRQQGIAFDAAGFGADGLNDRLLERLTRNGNGRYYVVDDPTEAGPGFAKQLAGAFRPAAENVKVQVKFNPSRVGRYKLIGFEEHRLKKEDFRNDAVDAAEMASEEAGVALYQFEILPEGEGEVGEVSVRFRDAASGRMVERTWTIPYDPQAPAFDQAKTSLQLAGLAAFAAEKLRQTPMAEAVDFGGMRGVMAAVKAAYGKSGRVAELERMIGKLE